MLKAAQSGPLASSYLVAHSPCLRFFFLITMPHRTQAFSLLEALCMIVTLFVFGWLCVGVFRYDVKNSGAVAGVQGLNTTPDLKPDAKDVKDAPKPAEETKAAPAESKSKPAGSPATAPAKP